MLPCGDSGTGTSQTQREAIVDVVFFFKKATFDYFCAAEPLSTLENWTAVSLRTLFTESFHMTGLQAEHNAGSERQVGWLVSLEPGFGVRRFRREHVNDHAGRPHRTACRAEA